MEQYLIYLRKSRADREAEGRGQGDTLARHRAALLSLAEGRRLPIAGIYEEVVSGETIAARPEMRRLLRDVESGAYAGVLVMEVERLARGNTRDQGIVAETFQYSNTRIITPGKVYDPEDEADQEYFEFGLFMSRREYKAINRRLQQGRRASLQEGKYIAGTPPYGYRRAKLEGEKGYTLEIVPGEAEVVRRIYDLYLNGEPQPGGGLRRLGTTRIARRLDAEGIPSPSGRHWPPCSVKDILANPTYAGMLRWSYRPTVRQMEQGEIVMSRPINHDMPLLPGLHSAIIGRPEWERAQSILSSRAHPPLPKGRRLRNPLAGLVFCAGCGRSLERRPSRHGRDMLLCPDPHCAMVGAPLPEVEAALLEALRRWLEEYRLDAPSCSPGAAVLEELEGAARRAAASLEALRGRRARLCDLLEQGVYTPEVFQARSRLLEEQLAQRAEALAGARRRADAARAPVPGENAAAVPEHILDGYWRLDAPELKNALLKALVQRVYYTRSAGGVELFLFPKLR